MIRHNKLIFYGIVISIFISISVLYVFIILTASDAFYRSSLNEKIEISRLQIDGIFRADARKIFSGLNPRIPDTANFSDILVEAEKALPGADLYYADAEGTVYSADNKKTGVRLENRILKETYTNGYSVAAFTRLQRNERLISLVIAVPSNPLCYILHTYSVEDYMASIKKSLLIYNDSLMLFDEFHQPFMANTDQRDNTAAETALVRGSLLYAMEPDKYSMQKNSFQKYSIFIPLTAPSGWYLGVHADFGKTRGFFTGIFYSSFVILILCAIIVAVIISLDVMNERRQKKKLFVLSNSDPLTGLTNNTGIGEAAASFMAEQPIADFSFVYMDIVAFNRINNMFGYSAGDMLLRCIGNVIKRNFFSGARAYADVFMFFSKKAENLAETAEQIFYDAIAHDMGGEYIQMISFKFGIFPLRQQTNDFRRIQDGAFFALKRAKKAYKQPAVIYDAQLEKMMVLRKNIEMNMLHALSKGEFMVYLQPQFDARTETCCGGEALIRWQSETMGLLPPDMFIPSFENNGFIIETDLFILEAVLKFLQNRQDSGLELKTIAVNQSKVTILFPNYLQRLKILVQQYTVPLSYIEIEITESMLENNMNTLLGLVHRIKDLGFSVAMDDFGAGFSSLNTLRMLPIDVLKIDKEFLQESDTSERSRSIIVNILNMARELHIRTICEGVETTEQVRFLKETGCNMLQGYYFSKPIPIEECESLFFNQPGTSGLTKTE